MNPRKRTPASLSICALRWVALLAMAACAGSPVQSYKGENANLGKGHSFQWLTPTDAVALKLHDPGIDYLTWSVHVEQRPDQEAKLRPEIENALAREGYVPVSNGQPDFYVTYYSKAKDQSWVSTWSGTTPGIDGVPVVISPQFDRGMLRKFRDGDVYLVLYSRQSKSSAWTGVDSQLKNAPTLTNADVLAGISRLMEELRKSS